MANVEEKVYSRLQLQPSMKGSSCQNPVAETEPETMEECYPLACSLWIAQLAFLRNPALPAQSSCTHNGLGPHISQ